MAWLVFGSVASLYAIVLIAGHNIAQAKEAWDNKYPEYRKPRGYGHTMSLIDLIKFQPKH